MEAKAFFSDIHQVIIDQLDFAQEDIIAAVAWFTDHEIFDVLCKKSLSGINVSIAIIGDRINQGPRGLNFDRLTSSGGKVYFLPSGIRHEPIMHNKYCVIDSKTVVTGSYNWSSKARSNDENITVITDTLFAEKFIDTFHKIVARVNAGKPILSDNDAVRRRLDLIRNLVLLAEHEGIPDHLDKLRPVAKELKLEQIIEALDSGEYKKALEKIDTYPSKATAIVDAELADIPRLKFTLEALEIRLESLSDEKTELERRLIIFNRSHDDFLGDLIKQLLKAKAELARLVAESNIDNEGQNHASEEAAKAKQNYEQYNRQHEQLKRSEPIPQLGKDAELELKALYRKACNLCHPDKVAKDQKKAAQTSFIELQQAFKGNNLDRVREIYETLKAGGTPSTRSAILTESDALRAAISEMEYAISKIVIELKALWNSDGFLLLTAAGETDSDWDVYFQKQSILLKEELNIVLEEINDFHKQERT